MLTYIKNSLLFLFLCIAISPAKASHDSYGEIYYRWAPTATDSLRYEIIVDWFWHLAGASSDATEDICIRSSCFSDTTISLNKLIPPSHLAAAGYPSAWAIVTENSCADSNDPNYSRLQIMRYSGFISLPGTCGDFKFSTIGAPYTYGLSDNLNSSSLNFYLEATLNNTLGESSSAQITSSPMVSLCVKPSTALESIFYQHAFDPEGDSIVYRLSHSLGGPICGPSGPIPYLPGFTSNNPIPSHTGLNFDPRYGRFALKASQQGSYNLRVVVESWTFDPISLQWLMQSSSSREIAVGVTANCDPLSQTSLNLNSSMPGIYSQNYFSGSQIDSLRGAYNVNQIHIDSAAGTSISFYNDYQCLQSLIPLEFDKALRKNSVDETDFRVLGPDSIARPVLAIIDSCDSDLCSKIYLQLLHPLVKNGNYLVQIKTGNDGNTLISECGYMVPEFTSFIIPVNNCPSPSYQLNQVTLKDDLNLMVHWTASPELQDSSVYALFQSWDLFVSKNNGPWQLEKRILDPLARRYQMDFGGSRQEVDQNNYKFKLDLNYAGSKWGETRSCTNILLQSSSVQSTAVADVVQLQWNHYECLPASSRKYYLQYGRYHQNININWQPPIIVQGNSASISLPKTAGSGTYAIRVYARADGNRLLPSESNWLMHDMSLDPNQVSGQQSSWIIPNLISPNGDGQNDRFFFIIPPADAGVQQIALRIYNRDGVLKFEDLAFQNNNNPNMGWDGSDLNGNAVAKGVYFYLISYINPNTGQNVNLQGSVSVLR